MSCNLLWLVFEEKYAQDSAQLLFCFMPSENPSMLFVPCITANVTPENKLVGCFFAYLKSNNLDSGMSC
jgi:hypothetical protein